MSLHAQEVFARLEALVIPQTDRDDAFNEGWEAFVRGCAESDNPYVKGKVLHTEWMNGFLYG